MWGRCPHKLAHFVNIEYIIKTVRCEYQHSTTNSTNLLGSSLQDKSPQLSVSLQSIPWVLLQTKYTYRIAISSLLSSLNFLSCYNPNKFTSKRAIHTICNMDCSISSHRLICSVFNSIRLFLIKLSVLAMLLL